ncbi:MAG: hypothetical protein QXO71_02740 [Candidatus Jordarchaeaceae archaeon]
MSFENIGWADFEALQNVNEYFKLLKQGLENLDKDKYEDALSAFSDASTLIYMNLNRFITCNIDSRHLWSVIVQFNLLVISLALSFLVRTKQNREEAEASLGGATGLVALITGFLNPLIRSFMEQEARTNGFRLNEKDRSLLGDMMQLNETVREFKKQFEEFKKSTNEAKPKKTSRKRKEAYQ